jgi:hypothetical protein
MAGFAFEEVDKRWAGVRANPAGAGVVTRDSTATAGRIGLAMSTRRPPVMSSPGMESERSAMAEYRNCLYRSFNAKTRQFAMHRFIFDALALI